MVKELYSFFFSCPKFGLSDSRSLTLHLHENVLLFKFIDTLLKLSWIYSTVTTFLFMVLYLNIILDQVLIK